MAYTLIEDEPQKKGYKLIEDGKNGTGSTTLDAGNAIGTGYFNGLTRLLGLPVDTVANIRDLGKAAGGSAYIAATGKEPPSWLQLGDRSNDVGSGDYLLKKARETKAGRVMLDPVNPDYTGGYTQLAGSALNGVVQPRSVLQGVNQGVNSVLSTWAGKRVYDETGSNALSIAAGMSPTAAQSAATEGMKYAIRGGESGRKTMEQRIQDLKSAGVDKPTLGIASGNSFIGGVENLLQSTPGAVGIMRNSRDAAVAGLEAKVNGAADMSSTNRGSISSGQSIQSGAKTFRDDFKDRQVDLYGKLDQFIPPLTPVNIGNTRSTLSALNADIPTMPKLSEQFKNSRIQSIEGALNSDMAGTSGTPTKTVPSSILGADGKPMALLTIPGIPGIPARDTAPFTAVKQTRTLVGNEIADTNLASSVPRSKWNPLYGALSGDMQAAATAAGPDATRTFNRANDYTRAGVARLDKIDPIVSRDTPEGSFRALEGTLKDNATAFQAVKKSLPEGSRGDFAGTIIERLGKSTAGQQNEIGSRFSTETFLTNWNKMGDKAKAELLSGFPNSSQVRADIEAVAKATSMMRDNSKIWANPSGTGANLAARGYLGLLGGGAALSADPMLILAGASLPVGANLAARAVTSPKVVKSMASRSYIDPQMLNAQVNSLISGGLLEYPQK